MVCNDGIESLLESISKIKISSTEFNDNLRGCEDELRNKVKYFDHIGQARNFFGELYFGMVLNNVDFEGFDSNPLRGYPVHKDNYVLHQDHWGRTLCQSNKRKRGRRHSFEYDFLTSYLGRPLVFEVELNFHKKILNVNRRLNPDIIRKKLMPLNHFFSSPATVVNVVTSLGYESFINPCTIQHKEFLSNGGFAVPINYTKDEFEDKIVRSAIYEFELVFNY